MKLATLCYIRQSAKTLMIHRVKKANDIHAGKWNGLGGKLEPGESPEECVVREVLEESGLRATRLHLKGFLTFPLFAANEDWYAFVFVVDEFGGELIDSPEGDLEWIDDDKLLSLNLWEGDLLFLPLLDQPGLFSAKIVYRDGRLVSHSLIMYHP